jgi:signal transduction histidine kinase
MPKGGTLTIKAGPDQRPGHVLIEISDTGCGIPADQIGRVFEPFYTTKPKGKGTGLGLAICRRIVSGHQGTLDLTSEVGKGTTVRISLPIGECGLAMDDRPLGA